MAKKRIKQVAKKTKVDWKFPMERKNWILFFIGLAVIVVGFLLMATGITQEPAVANGKWNNPFAIVVAPILLVIGYCVIIPYAIIKYNKKDASPENINE